jgi:hypothetical protein
MTFSTEVRGTGWQDTIVVVDSEGGIWWPNESAQEQIYCSADPDAEAIRICTNQPTRGTWL